MRGDKIFGNVLGAFADGAVLFPLLALLAMKTGFSGAVLLASAGVAYWVAGIVFRVPMSVQPLKSVAVAAVAVGASVAEVRYSGAMLGLFCLLLSLGAVNQWSEKVPASLIHSLQLALGVLLCMQGVGAGVLSLSLAAAGWLGIAGLAIRFASFPLLGLIATAGILWAVFSGVNHDGAQIPQTEQIRPWLVVSLLVPQMALTLANSVIGTKDVAKRYFGQSASRVTVRALLRSIGGLNIFSALIGGLPLCHGAGGVTAHVRGGATSWAANGIIGSTLLLMAYVAYITNRAGDNVAFQYPAVLTSVLLITTGIFHMLLAAPTWRGGFGRIKLLVAAAVVLFTRNMLAVLLTGVVFEFVERICVNDQISRRFKNHQ